MAVQTTFQMTYHTPSAGIDGHQVLICLKKLATDNLHHIQSAENPSEIFGHSTANGN